MLLFFLGQVAAFHVEMVNHKAYVPEICFCLTGQGVKVPTSENGVRPWKVAEFDEKIGVALPKQYRNYLLSAFDEQREETCFRASATAE